jgi:hypothetical protein
MSSRLHPLLLCYAGLAATGCGPAQGTETPAPADPAVYEQHVQPYTAVSCATLDCHGDPGRPLRMYSELGLRRDPTLRTQAVSEARPAQPLTAEELADNLAAFGAVSDVGPRHMALLKPLAGHVHHLGGTLWPNEEAPGYLCLRGWLAPDPASPVDTGQACAMALDALGF